MLKENYKNDGAYLRIGSRKTFRISSRKIETLRDRRNLDFDLEFVEVFGDIYEAPIEPGPPPPGGVPPIPKKLPSSRTAINEEQ